MLEQLIRDYILSEPPCTLTRQEWCHALNLEYPDLLIDLPETERVLDSLVKEGSLTIVTMRNKGTSRYFIKNTPPLIMTKMGPTYCSPPN